MRAYYNAEELAAALVLDYVREGGDVPAQAITRALWVLGDLVGVGA